MVLGTRSTQPFGLRSASAEEDVVAMAASTVVVNVDDRNSEALSRS